MPLELTVIAGNDELTRVSPLRGPSPVASLEVAYSSTVLPLFLISLIIVLLQNRQSSTLGQCLLGMGVTL